MTGSSGWWRSVLALADVRWAKEHDSARLVTSNEERNAPIRALNARHGYLLEPGLIVLRGPVTPVR